MRGRRIRRYLAISIGIGLLAIGQGCTGKAERTIQDEGQMQAEKNTRAERKMQAEAERIVMKTKAGVTVVLGPAGAGCPLAE